MRRTTTTLLFALLLVPSIAWAQPVPVKVAAPDAYAQAPEPGDSPSNQVAPKPALKETTKAPVKATKAPVKEPQTVAEAVDDASLLIEAAKSGDWVLFTGLLIMLLIFLLDKVIKLKEMLPDAAVPWVASGFGILGSVAVQLTTGIPWGQALLQGFTAGVTAVGLWELLFKALLKKKVEEPSDPETIET